MPLGIEQGSVGDEQSWRSVGVPEAVTAATSDLFITAAGMSEMPEGVTFSRYNDTAGRNLSQSLAVPGAQILRDRGGDGLSPVDPGHNDRVIYSFRDDEGIRTEVEAPWNHQAGNYVVSRVDAFRAGGDGVEYPVPADERVTTAPNAVRGAIAAVEAALQ